MGCVYVLRAESTNRYKVGWTTENTKNRLKTLQTGCPYRLIIWAEIESDHAWTEKIIHDSLKKYKVHGEWFEITEEKLSEILKIFGFEWGGLEEITFPGGHRLIRDTTDKNILYFPAKFFDAYGGILAFIMSGEHFSYITNNGEWFVSAIDVIKILPQFTDMVKKIINKYSADLPIGN